MSICDRCGDEEESQTYGNLELCDFCAKSSNKITTEQQLCDLYRSTQLESVTNIYGNDDTDAINEDFNNWTDMLCNEGTISIELYNNCEFVG